MKICTLNMMVDLIRLFSGSFLWCKITQSLPSSFISSSPSASSFIFYFLFFIQYINVFFLVIAHNLTSYLHHSPTYQFHSHLSKEVYTNQEWWNKKAGISNSSSVANIYQLYPNRGFEKASKYIVCNNIIKCVTFFFILVFFSLFLFCVCYFILFRSLAKHRKKRI